jgi:hypothetical protein
VEAGDVAPERAGEIKSGLEPAFKAGIVENVKKDRLQRTGSCG